MRLVLAGILALLPVFAAVPARAQMDTREGIALQNQILELRHELDSLRGQGGGGGSSLGYRAQAAAPPASPNDMTAQLLERVLRLEDDVRSLHGQMDELTNALQRQHDDLAKQIGDLGFRLDTAGVPGGNAAPGAAPGGPGPGSGPAPAAPPPASRPGYPPSLSPPPGMLGAVPSSPGAPPPAAPPARRTPEMAMQEGNAALARRDYAAAEAAAREVLAGPRGPRAIDAQFLLAQALNGKRDYANAAIAYDDSYGRSRTGPHAQDSLLGLANALVSLGDKRAACASLDKLKAEFPTTRQDLREPVAAARTRAGCR